MALFGKEAEGTLHYGKVQQKPVSTKKQNSALSHEHHDHSGKPRYTVSKKVEGLSHEHHAHTAKKVDAAVPRKTQPANFSTPNDAIDVIVSIIKFAAKIASIIRRIIFIIAFIFVVLIAIVSYAKTNNPSYGSSTLGTASAHVIRDTFTSNCTALSFGSISAKSSAGLVILSPKGKRSAYGLVSLGKADYQPSRCDILGAPDTNYSVKVPSTVEFTVTPNEETPPPRTGTLTFQEKFRLALQGKLGTPKSELRVSSIKVYSENKRISNFTGRTNGQGKDALLLGATLHVSINTLPGVYQGIIPVTVNY